MSRLHKRLETLEARAGIHAEPEPTLFLQVIDNSIPDPDGTVRHPPIGPATGVRPSSGSPTVHRLPGESEAALRKRAASLMPEVRVFMTTYENFPTTAVSNGEQKGHQ